MAQFFFSINIKRSSDVIMVIAIPIIVDFLKISLRFASGSDFYANDRFYREPALFRLDKIINCILNAMFS